MQTENPTLIEQNTQTPIQSPPEQACFKLEQMLGLMAFIINNLNETHTKSNRIKLVVDAAAKCCGIAIDPKAIHQMIAV